MAYFIAFIIFLIAINIFVLLVSMCKLAKRADEKMQQRETDGGLIGGG